MQRAARLEFSVRLSGGLSELGVGADLLDALVRSILLFVMLWIAGALWADFGAFFGAANSFYFGLAYLVAHAASVVLRDLVYHRSEVGPGRPRSTA